MFLRADELRELTDKRRCDAQRRVLDFMGVPYRVRPNGTLAVLRHDVEGFPGATIPAPREPEMQP